MIIISDSPINKKYSSLKPNDKTQPIDPNQKQKHTLHVPSGFAKYFGNLEMML